MDEFMNKVQNELLKAKLTEIFEMIQREFPSLKLEIKWNQPMFIMDKTFIIGFSASKAHISIAPEPQTIVALAEELKRQAILQAPIFLELLKSKK